MDIGNLLGRQIPKCWLRRNGEQERKGDANKAIEWVNDLNNQGSILLVCRMWLRTAHLKASQAGVCVCVRSVTQLCLTLCEPMDSSLPGILCTWAFPEENPGMGCHFLLPWIFLTKGLNPCLLRCKWILYHWVIREAYQAGVFIHNILSFISCILLQVAISSSLFQASLAQGLSKLPWLQRKPWGRRMEKCTARVLVGRC